MIPSTVPGVIAWPLIFFMIVVLVGRYWWFNSNLYERYFNTTLAFLLAAQVLREHLVQNLLVRTSFMTVGGAWQLATAVLTYSYTEFIGFTLLWSGLSEAQARRRHRYYRLAGVLFVAGFLIAGTPARVAGQPIEFTTGWESAATLICSTTMLMVLAARMIWFSLRELRRAGRRRDRVIAISTLSMGVAGVVNVIQESTLQLTDQLGWTHTAFYRQQFHASGLFFLIVGVFATAAVPCAMKLLGWLGLDPVGRSWRKLQPLRQDMRTVVPECVFNLDEDEPGRRKSQLQLHHTVVEIRDAILRLGPYVRDIPRDDVLLRFLHDAPGVDHDADAVIAALHLAHAARAKAAGRPSQQPLDVDAALIVSSRAATLEEETAELLELAKWWPAAYASTEHLADASTQVPA